MAYGSRRSLGIRRVQVILTALLAVAIAVPLLVGTRPSAVEARCYGRYKGRCLKYVGRCRRACGKTSGVIHACAGRDLKNSLKQCIQTTKQFVADCGGDASCQKQGKKLLSQCKKSAKKVQKTDLRGISGRNYGTPACNRCCAKTDGQGDCLSYFGNSRFAGAYRYGKKVFCPPPPTTPTTSSTTTTLRPPGSPSGAFVSSVTDRLRGYLTVLIPSLTSHWSD